MSKVNILFLCVHNSARSQMAEAYLKLLGKEKFEAESAGLEPGVLNPLAVEVMREEGIDISGNATKDVFTLHKQGKSFHKVISVCGIDESERCPVFQNQQQKLIWNFEDPSAFNGCDQEKLAAIRAVRDEIKGKVLQFVEEYAPTTSYNA